jgi:8-oxo-dGTP pyrophosphatase MutT (NUDIX family)
MDSASARPILDDGETPPRAVLLTNAEALARYLSTRLAQPAAAPDSGPLVEGWPTQPLTGIPPRQAAVLAPLYARDGEPYLIFTRRASDLSSHSGEISFPGGSRDAEDVSLAQTALRESYEELGLPRERVRVLGMMPTVFSVVSNFLVTPYVGWLGEGLPMLRPQATEVAEVIEAPLSALDDARIYHDEIWLRGGVSHTVHFYDFGAHRIWGLTGRMLHQLLALLPTR